MKNHKIQLIDITVYVLILILVMTNKTYSQSIKQRVADKEFNEMRYFRSAEIYSHLVKNNPDKSNIIKAAISNYKIANYVEAEKYFEMAYLLEGLNEYELLWYYQSLLYNRHYTKCFQLNESLNKRNKSYSYLIDSLQINNLFHDSTKCKIEYLKFNSEYSDFSPHIYKGDLYFISNRRNQSFQNKKYVWDNSYFLDIYKTKLNLLKNVEPINFSFKTNFHEGPIFISNSGLMFMTKSNILKNKPVKGNNNKVNLQLVYSFHPFSDTSTWYPFPYNSVDYSCGHPALNDSGNVLYFISDMPGSYGGTDIYVSYFREGKWTKPSNMGNIINTIGNEMFPSVYKNKLIYSSNGLKGLGGLDIYTIPLDTSEKSYPVNLGYPLNTNMDDFGCIYTSDTSGYFSSNRKTEVSKDDIYSFKVRSRNEDKNLYISVKDYNTGLIVLNSKVTVMASKNKVLDSFYSKNTPHQYKYVNSISIALTAEHEHYKEAILLYRLDSLITHDTITIYLKAQSKTLIYQAYDYSTNESLGFVRINLKDTTGAMYSFILNDSGYQVIDDKYLNYKLISAEMYNYIYVSSSKKISKDTIIVKLFLDKELKELQEKLAFSPIYFDFDKYNIRKDATKELDKIYNYLKVNKSIKISIISHTDCRNSNAYNLKLSSKRANATRNYFISKGIATNRIRAVGYGESKPVNSCQCDIKDANECSEELHSLNRRSEFLIISE